MSVPVGGSPRGACVCRLWTLAAVISDESELEVCIHDDALCKICKSAFFTSRLVQDGKEAVHGTMYLYLTNPRYRGYNKV